jgi:putative phage-type endonuclease
MSEQRTPEWYAERLGKATASRMADVLARTKSGRGASRADYAAQIIAERLTGKVVDRFVNADMSWGTDQEPFARDAYAFTADVDVEQVGFIDHPTIAMSGASPDGLVGADGLIEIKCPKTANHIDTLLDEPIANRYVLQMQWQLACTGRKWCDFVSFDPRLPEHMRLFVKRFKRDEKVIAELEREVALFLREIDTKLAALKAAYQRAA